MSRIGSWLLNVLYLGLLAVALPWILWGAATKGKYREGFLAKFFGQVPRRAGDRPCVWLHAVSVGEVNLLATLLRQIRQSHPTWEVVISTTTKTGMELALRKYGPEHAVFYCPLDFSWATRRAMRRVRPDLLVLAELELWPNLIGAAKASGARVAIANGRLSDNSFRGYRRGRWLVGRLLRQIDAIAAQDEATRCRFVALGARVDAVSVTGSLKYDGAETDRQNARTVALRNVARVGDNAPVFVVGSTQDPEESMALAIYQRLSSAYPNLRLVIVPRHPERFDEVAGLLAKSGVEWERRSKLASGISGPIPCVLLVDTIGELGAWWGMATVGFVGGSFGERGGQNMIEPAAYGVATSFGPNTWNFRDIVQALLAAEGAVVVRSEVELLRFVARAIGESEFAEELGGRARAFVATQLGATDRTIEILSTLMPRVDARQQRAA